MGGIGECAWVFVSTTSTLSSSHGPLQILEEAATELIEIALFWCVVDFLHDATFLGEDDRRRVIKRLGDDQQASAGYE